MQQHAYLEQSAGQHGDQNAHNVARDTAYAAHDDASPIQQQQPTMQQQGQQYAVNLIQGGYVMPMGSNMGINMGNSP